VITTSEVEQKSRDFGINPADVEKDYVYGCLLNGIYTQSALSSRLGRLTVFRLDAIGQQADERNVFNSAFLWTLGKRMTARISDCQYSSRLFTVKTL
jgi:hypothetical protein